MLMIGAVGGLSASTTFAQLLWANGANQPLNSLVPGGQTTTFRTGNTLGRICMITDTITGLTPDSAAATFAMVAWDNSSGRFPTWTQASVGWMAGQTQAGESAAVTVSAIGGSVNTPPIVMAPSFNIYPGPEPSAGALALLGLGFLFLFRRRKLIVAAFALTVAGSVFAQGTVVFSSYNYLGTVHYWGASATSPMLSLQGNSPADTPAGTTDYAAVGMTMLGTPGSAYGAATTFAQLLWANGASQPANSLVPGGQTTTFRTGNTVGRITFITDTITGLTPDSAAATFAMVAWDNSSGQYADWTTASRAWMSGKIAAGESTAITVNAIGGSVNTPPIVMLPSFNIWPSPEPSTGALALLGLGCLLLLRRRKLIVAAFALTIAGSVFAQGTVVFSSYNYLGTVHYWGPSTTAPDMSLLGNGASDTPAGTTDYAAAGMTMLGTPGSAYGAATTFAQLLWANGANQPANSLVPGGQTTTFRTGNTVGRISMITDTITGLTPDSAAATFAMVAWDNSSGRFPTWTQASVGWMAGQTVAGESAAITVNAIGGSVNTPPIVMLPSFNLYPGPEPSTGALALVGLGCLFLFRRRKLIVAAFALTLAGSVFAQGTVLFGSYNSLGTVHYWGSTMPIWSLQGNGTTDTPVGPFDYAAHGMIMIGAPGGYSAATTFAQLLWANGASQPPDSLVPGGQTTTFRSGNTVGRISLITDTIIGLTPDSAAATFAMVAWDNSSGQYPTWTQASAAWDAGKIAAGESTAFSVNNIGGSMNVPPVMLPPSFDIFPWPEPSTGALTLLGLGCLLLCRRRKLMVAAFALTVAGSVFAQGTVILSSYNSLGTVHFWVASPTAPWQSLSGNSAADSPAGTTDYEHYGMMLIGSTGTGGHWGSSTTFAQLLWANGASQPLTA